MLRNVRKHSLLYASRIRKPTDQVSLQKQQFKGQNNVIHIKKALCMSAANILMLICFRKNSVVAFKKMHDKDPFWAKSVSVC
jgi:hypothetical protein